jgi:hypothetical protein
VGAASGRVDALAFTVGLVAGVWVFAEVYTAVARFVWSGGLASLTLADMLGVPFWLLAGVVVVMALGMFWLLGKLEPRIARDRS